MKITIKQLVKISQFSIILTCSTVPASYASDAFWEDLYEEASTTARQVKSEIKTTITSLHREGRALIEEAREEWKPRVTPSFFQRSLRKIEKLTKSVQQLFSRTFRR